MDAHRCGHLSKNGFRSERFISGSGPDRVESCWHRSPITSPRRRTSCGAVAIRGRTGARLGWHAAARFTLSLSRMARISASGAPAPPIRRSATTPIRQSSRYPAPLTAARPGSIPAAPTVSASAYSRRRPMARSGCHAKYLQWRARHQVVAHHAWAEQVGIVGRALACWRRCAYSRRGSRGSLERYAPGQMAAADHHLYRDVSLTSTRISGA